MEYLVIRTIVLAFLYILLLIIVNHNENKKK